VSLLAIVSSLALAPACTIVIGDEPAHDAGSDGATMDADDAATPLEEAGAVDAGPPDDGGAPGDAGSTMGLDAALADAGADANADAAGKDAGPTDSGMIDTGPPLDCDGGGTLYYPDGDKDGYGRSAELVKRCAKPSGDGWALQGGDCKDNDPDVHPQQMTYRGMPYMGADGNPSFNYDCSDAEEGDPSQQKLEGSCGVLDLLACSNSGYLATERAGGNPFCGSTTRGFCMAAGILGCSLSEVPDQPAYRCK
jgi:hypothetical protein